MKQHPIIPSAKFEIFPHSFIRYASGHHAEFEQLVCKKIGSLYKEVNAAATEFDELKELICGYLYHAIKDALTITDKQILLNIKRDIYNSRDPDRQQWENFLENLPSEKRPVFEKYTYLKAAQNLLRGEWQNVYQKNMQHHRTVLQRISESDLLHKGIRLSSKALFDQLNSFARAPVTSFKNKELRQEYSLLRYITRMYFKTSPFSTFTYLGLCSLTQTDLVYEPFLSGDVVHSKIRLNNEIFSYLKTLLTLNPEINEQLYVQLNPTIQLSDEQVTFLINFHNLESFQKLANTSVINALLEINADKKEPYRLNNFIEKLEEIVDSSKAGIKAYLLRLIEIGFLEFDFQTSGIDPDWDLALIKYLKNINKPSALLNETVEVLHKQRSYCESYAQSEAIQRGEILEQMYQDFHTLFNQYLDSIGFLKQDQGAYKKQYTASFSTEQFKKNPYLLSTLTTEKLIYEDSFIQGSATIDREAITTIVEGVNELCEMLQPVDSINEERNRIRTFYLDHYRKDQNVNLLEFYHSYYLHVKNPQKDLQQKDTKALLDQHQENYRTIYKKWVEQFKQILKPSVSANAVEIVINRQMIDDIKKSLPGKTKNRLVSRAMFAQCFQKEGNLQVVLSHIFQGMGRAGGRFLHLFDPDITESLRIFNKRISTNFMLMELSDGSYFNANAHPPLLDYEVRIPDAHNSLPAESQIAVKDIQVYYDATVDEVCLFNSLTGLRILPFDLCLQSLTQRSKLYQLLAHFSPDQSVSFSPVQRAIQELIFTGADLPGKREVYHFPRIIYEKQIIIKRRSWSVLTSFVPKKGDQQSEADYFMIINHWREKNAFPNQIFLYLRSGTSGQEQDAADDYKPQYIRFDTPLLILLWVRLLKKAGEYIYFEEMMPDTETLGPQPVNELLIQWYYQ